MREVRPVVGPTGVSAPKRIVPTVPVKGQDMLMAVAAHHTLAETTDWGIPFWLPGGRDNGVADHAWAPIIDVNSEAAADLILLELKDAGVPGYTARVRQPGKHELRRGHTDSIRMRIWVGCSAYGRAEATIMRIVPKLVKSSGRQIIS